MYCNTELVSQLLSFPYTCFSNIATFMPVDWTALSISHPGPVTRLSLPCFGSVRQPLSRGLATNQRTSSGSSQGWPINPPRASRYIKQYSFLYSGTTFYTPPVTKSETGNDSIRLSERVVFLPLPLNLHETFITFDLYA